MCDEHRRSSTRRRRHHRDPVSSDESDGASSSADVTDSPSSRVSVHRYSSIDASDTVDSPEQPEFDPKEGLTVKIVDLKIQENTKAHHTNEYDMCSPSNKDPQLIVRRGQPFTIDIEFSKAYDEKNDDLRLNFQAGDRPRKAKGTLIELILTDEDKPKEWGAEIVSNEGTTLSVQIFTPPTCFVGAWDLNVEVIKKDDSDVTIFIYEHEHPVYIIFNPLCEDDSVYMEDEEKRKEYVFNETGSLYYGNRWSIGAKPWNFGQFEEYVFDAVMYLLDISRLKWAERGNPIALTRKITALVNVNDDNGVVVGNWSGTYTGGRSPLSWTGSAAILREYFKKKKPVKYGQCWVFSGVCTTVCRALGIPCRSVSNFSSAHDTDGSITIDNYFTAEGESNEAWNSDSIWNFHVWNEAWMSRPDLPTGYGGWQAIDATPQETSNYVYQCGPVSVQAIKQGDVNLKYDAPFVFAEVNADRCYWSPNELGKLECFDIDQTAVGKNISTKAVNAYKREDITIEYKGEEGSAEERVAVLKANELGSWRRNVYTIRPSDVKFRIEQDVKNTWVGGNFELSLHVKNTSKDKRTVRGRIIVKTMYYTGVTEDKVMDDSFRELHLKAGQETSRKVIVKPEHYLGKLKDCCMLDVSVWALVSETNQHFTLKENYRFLKPDLTIKAPKEGTVGKEIKVEVSFTNPLNTTLTQCFVVVAGLREEKMFSQGIVSPKGNFTATLAITPKKAGTKDLIIIFNSEQLEDINGFHTINVKEA